jgi:N-acetylglucosaminyl-diphospho-decaprenol L-rhamnosyltransferase
MSYGAETSNPSDFWPVPAQDQWPVHGFAGRPAAAAKACDVDIGVIYTHESELMPRLLSSLGQSADGLSKRLVLVDNDSQDGVERFLGYIPETKVICNPQRLCYAVNLNRVLQDSTARYVLLLNTDMFFDPQQQCVSRMVRFMDTEPDCGIAGCRLYHEDGRHAPSARRFQTIPIILARRFGLARWMRRTLDSYFYQDHDIRETWECDWLSGCFLMIRREAFREVGLFDAGFGKYFEDVDMCLRMARAGWRVMYHGAVYCYHLEQRASRRLFSADARQHARAYLRWLMKWGFLPDRGLSERPRRRRAA